MKKDLEFLLNLFEDLAIENNKRLMNLGTDGSEFSIGLFRGQEIAYDITISAIKRIIEQNS